MNEHTGQVLIGEAAVKARREEAEQTKAHYREQGGEDGFQEPSEGAADDHDDADAGLAEPHSSHIPVETEMNTKDIEEDLE